MRFLKSISILSEIVGAVELDDASHRRSDREARDFFVNVIFSGAGIPLVRVPAQSQYFVQELRARFPFLQNAPAKLRLLLRVLLFEHHS